MRQYLAPTSTMLCLLIHVGCQREPAPAIVEATAVTPDRLQPEESLPETQRIFGIEVPRGLRLVSDFGDRASLIGPLPLAEAITYFSQQVESTPIEVANERAVFARVRLKANRTRHEYRIELTRKRHDTFVLIADVTPPPVTHGIDEKARWEQAGRKPDGTLIDPRRVY
jgi:hypothetical protein